MGQEPRLSDTSAANVQDPVDRGKVARRMGERFLLGSLIGLAIALILSGAANIALVRDAECRKANLTSRRAFQAHSCLSDVSYWEVDALARGPAAAGDADGGTLMSWLSVPLAYALLGGLVAQLSLRKALIGGLILQLILMGLLAAMAFFAVYVS